MTESCGEDTCDSQSLCPVSAGQTVKTRTLSQAGILPSFQHLDCSKSLAVGKRRRMQFHFCGCKASAGTRALTVRDSQRAIQGHSWIQFSPRAATKLHLKKRKAFSVKQRTKFLFVGKQPLSPLPLGAGLVFAILTQQKFQIFSERCLFYFQITYKPHALSANTTLYSSCYSRTRAIPAGMKVVHFRGLDSGLKTKGWISLTAGLDFSLTQH